MVPDVVVVLIQLRRTPEVAKRFVELADRYVTVAAVTVEPRIVRMIGEKL